ncbi:DUF3662 domain-containing protein [Streptomyces fructofermentans]|uniref:FhaA N-terminal domain-containing protein n=1 Tax=Streptomyces fructofermentans TaxID=152141 RepID=A0A918KB64_9ACTN|nr:DUF3662 domain-containing protein [Streptomyces fructofermentans]GGX57277.1 hypothetical protein GCM10010515_26060 [Streptomyces fructofermentans]
MGTLTRWERAVERFEDALFAHLRGKGPVELVDALHGECDSNVVLCSERRVVVPNAYDIELSETVHDELARRGSRVGQVLTDSLARHGARKGYEWAGPLVVRVTKSTAALPNGRYRVASCVMRHVRADAFQVSTG